LRNEAGVLNVNVGSVQMKKQADKFGLSFDFGEQHYEMFLMALDDCVLALKLISGLAAYEACSVQRILFMN
jgi:hypothetical protein